MFILYMFSVRQCVDFESLTGLRNVAVIPLSLTRGMVQSLADITFVLMIGGIVLRSRTASRM